MDRLKQAAESRTRDAQDQRARFEQRMLESGIDAVCETWNIKPGLKEMNLKESLNRVRQLLMDGEKVLAVTCGDAEDAAKTLFPTTAIVLTDSRLLVGAREYALSDLDELQGYTKLLKDRIEWGARRRKVAGMRNLPTGHGARFATAFAEAKAQSNTAEIPPQPAGPGSSVADELQKFASLRDAGVLSQEEFEAKKAQLLA